MKKEKQRNWFIPTLITTVMIQRGYLTQKEKKLLIKKITKHYQFQISNIKIDIKEFDSFYQNIKKINNGQKILPDKFVDDCLKQSKEFVKTDASGVVKGSAEQASKEVSRLVKQAHADYLENGNMSKAIKEVTKRYKGDTIQFKGSKRKMRMDHYIKMQARTAITQSRVDTARTYAMENNLDIFQVSAHDGARKKCYPYQGLLISWSGNSGSFVGVDGKTYHYISINDTSYGEPDGLFGINCKHEPLPVDTQYFSDTISKKVPSKEKNAAQINSLTKRRGTAAYK